MSKTIDLTISDRVAIGRYINLIRCTIPIRLVIDEFNDKFVPTLDELKKAGAVIEMGKLAEVKDDFVKSYNADDVPAVIKKGIEEYIAELTTRCSETRSRIQTRFNDVNIRLQALQMGLISSRGVEVQYLEAPKDAVITMKDQTVIQSFASIWGSK